VLDDTGKIAETDVDVFDFLVFDLLDDVVGCLVCHVVTPVHLRGSR
jgi:hypothetical protein